MADESPDGRLTEIEIKLSFTENLVDELNRTVYRQQQRIDALERAMVELRSQMEALATAADFKAGTAPDPRDEVPPHY